MLRQLPVGYAVVIVAFACAHYSQKASHAGDSSADANCPVTSYSEADRKGPNLGKASGANPEFVSFIVDGQRAAWNLPNSTHIGTEFSESPPPQFDPPIDWRRIQIVRVVQGEDAKRLYNACPGVLVVDLRTETGDWHPAIKAEAFIGSSGAQFIFPPDSAASFAYDVPQARTYEGAPEFSWEVNWEIPEDRERQNPHALLLVTRRRLGGPRTGSLSTLISRDSLKIMTYCACGDAVASTPETDPNVFAYVKNGRLIFNVRGADAVRRIFGMVPDSVTFSRAHRDDPDSEEVLKVRVVRRNP